MIVSNRHKFVFFHNPKVAGSSVHVSLAGFHDSQIPASGVGPNDRLLAHDGIDEFARKNPDAWMDIKGWKMFALYRGSFSRFVSSFSQYSRSFGEVDVRFSTPDKSRDYLFSVLDMLSAYGNAEGVIDQDRLVLFRPQWIYLRSEDPTLDLSVFDIREIDQLFDAVEKLVNEPIDRKRVNERERFDLPAPLAKLLSNGNISRNIGRLPGAKTAKTLFKRKFKADDAQGGLRLSERDIEQIKSFVNMFYERDQAFFEQMSKKTELEVQ